jgi:hypothetical protein
MYALHKLNDEERSHDGVWLIAVSDSVERLEEQAVEIETEQLREQLEDMPLPGQEPVAELAWADWGIPGSMESVALVPWGRYAITEVEVV